MQRQLEKSRRDANDFEMVLTDQRAQQKKKVGELQAKVGA
jgi:hypothetical protein